MSNPVSLTQFVSQTLVDIAQGVADARGRVAELGGAVNPALEGEYVGYKSSKHVVEFDVSVFAESVSGGALGASTTIVGILSFSAEGDTDVDRKQAQNRIKFSIPMQLPTGKDTDRPGRDPSTTSSSWRT